MSFAIDIFLQPGEVYFGEQDTRIRTLLGSCVAITWWHPQRKLGGMCHYLLPSRPQSQARGDAPLDGRYADEAFALAMAYIQSVGTLPAEYQVKMFGGGDMLDSGLGAKAIGERNIEYGKHWLANHGFRLNRAHLAGEGHRNIVFDIATGDVWVKFQPRNSLI